MKKIIVFAVTLLLVINLFGCGNQTANTTTSDSAADATSETATEGQTESDATNEETALEESLVVYSTHSEEMLELVADAFTEKTGVKVDFINLKGELADRVRAEKDNPQADIMYGGASSLFIEMADEDIFESTEPSWADELNSMFKDAEGRWYGTIKTPVVLFYNTDMISEEDAPKDWMDLTDAAFKDLIVTRDSASSSNRATIMSLIYQFEKEGDLDAGWEYLKGLDANIKSYYNSETLMFQAIGKQEAAISYATQSSVIDNITQNNMPLQIIDATSGSVIITDGIAAIKNAPHSNAAAAFVEFAGSAEVQALLANEFNRIPTLPSALDACPEWMRTDYAGMDIDWGIISENQNEWLQTWETEVRNVEKDFTN